MPQPPNPSPEQPLAIHRATSSKQRTQTHRVRSFLVFVSATFASGYLLLLLTAVYAQLIDDESCRGRPYCIPLTVLIAFLFCFLLAPCIGAWVTAQFNAWMYRRAHRVMSEQERRFMELP